MCHDKSCMMCHIYDMADLCHVHVRCESVIHVNTSRSHDFDVAHIVQAKRVEMRTHLSEEYQKEKHNYKKKSMTVDDINARHARVVLSQIIRLIGMDINIRTMCDLGDTSI